MDDHTRDPSVGSPSQGTPTGWLPAEERWKHDTLRHMTVHGGRLYNAGGYHGSHDCFGNVWSSVNDPYRRRSGFEWPTTTS
jgi:formylglycine-generating enzyme required for sulfatase activity